MDKVHNSPATAREFLGIRPDTLRAWRVLGKGPKFFRQGGRVYYRESDIREYLDSLATLRSTSDEAAVA